jgi:hypothetical protein
LDVGNRVTSTPISADGNGVAVGVVLGVAVAVGGGVTGELGAPVALDDLDEVDELGETGAGALVGGDGDGVTTGGDGAAPGSPCEHEATASTATSTIKGRPQADRRRLIVRPPARFRHETLVRALAGLAEV